MIFQIKKDKSTDNPSLETETIERWRRVSLAAEKERTQLGEQTDLLSDVDSESASHQQPEEAGFLKSQKNKFFGKARAGIEKAGGNKTSSEEAEEVASAGGHDFNRPLSEQIEHVNEPQIVTSDPSLDIEDDLKRRFGSNVKSALGSGTVIEGKFKFDSPVRVDGTLSGEINSSSVLIVGKEASIEGTVSVGSLIVLGNVKAEIQASDLVEIRSGGRLDGDISTKRITIEDGGIFQGHCNS